MNEVDDAIGSARRSWQRIVDPYADKDRKRRWFNTIFLGAVLVIFGVGFAIRQELRSGEPATLIDSVADFGPLLASFGFAAMLYSILQLYLDGSLSSRKVESLTATDAAAAKPLDIPVEPTMQTGGDLPAASRPKIVRPRFVITANAMRSRLRTEIISQGRKAQTNLAMGVLTALSAIGFLGWLALSVSTFPAELMTTIKQESRLSSSYITMFFWALFVAKVALSFSASVFSFFFLSTYRRNLGEIKYFQNELTNIEIRLFSIYFASNKDLPKVLERLLLSNSDVERNFILRKGETTVDIRSRELDASDVNALSAALAKALSPIIHSAKPGAVSQTE